ncbi:hypothetical protein RB195_006004 [Necator americanus]
MLNFITYLRLALYLTGNLTSIPTLAILLRSQLLHRNFRLVLIIIILSGYFISFVTYLNFAVIILDISNKEEIMNKARIIFYCGAALFVYGNLCLTIERYLAVCFVTTYEKYSSSKASAALTIICVTLPAFVFGGTTSKLPPDHVLFILSFSACSVASVAVSAYLRFHKPTRMVGRISSLCSRYQIKENNKTMVIYLSLSLNELITAIIMLVLVYFIYKNYESFELEEGGYAASGLDLVTSYRIVAIHLALMYYWYKEKRTRRTVTICTSQTAEEYYKTIKEIWK